MSWPMNTRLRKVPLPAIAGTSLLGQTFAWDIPKSGILAAILLVITGNVTTAVSTPVAIGKSNLVTRVRLTANSGLTLIDLSGPGYHFMTRDFLGGYQDPVPQSDGRAVQATGAFDLSMWLPVAINKRDPIGLVMLQNSDTLLRLELVEGPSAAMGNDITVLTFNATPYLYLFSVPQDDKDLPPFDFAHTLTEEAQTVSGAGEVDWNWPRGGIYCQVIHGLNISAAGSDGFTTAALRVNQADYIVPPTPPAFFTRDYSSERGRTRLAGVIPIFDGLGDSGLGTYGSGRDLLDSRALTDIQSVIQATSAGTLRTVKRQLFPLPKA